MFNCYSQFRRARRSLGDEEGAGRQLSATTEHHITAVRTMLKENARVTVVYIAEEVIISSGRVTIILHEKLHFSKIYARKVPYKFTQVLKVTRMTVGLQC